MIQTHISTLNETGLALMGKATELTKLADIERCIKLGSDLLSQAREILRQQESNSVLIFADFCQHKNVELSYSLYLEFCSRNNMPMFSEEDYLSYTKNVLGWKTS